MPITLASPKIREALVALKPKWGWVLALGIAMILAGLLAFANVLAATIASVLFTGAMLLAAGIAQMAQAFTVKTWKQTIIWALIGALYAFAGIITILNPLLASTALTLVFAVSVIAAGVLRIVSGFSVRPMQGWGWLVAGGVLAIAVGAIVLAGWPVNSLWIIGLLLAVDLTFHGWAVVALALFLRRAEVEPGAPETPAAPTPPPAPPPAPPATPSGSQPA